MNIIKNIIQIIGEEIRGLSPRARLYIVLSVCAIAAGVLLYMVHLSSAQFARDYELYSFLAKTQQNDAYIPGASDNPVRQQLNQILSDALTKKMSDADRLTLVKGGSTFLNESQKQIDQITVSSEAADAAIAKMQVDTLDAFSISQNAREIIALAKERSSMISDIRAYSYRADFDVQQIFNRIIQDNGKLTDAYVTELNSADPEMASQYDKRTNLYNDLQKLGDDLDKKSQSLGFF